ncbi:MAG: DUF3387 domain-containing protein, partial [Actinomycetota bacterium]|nr:DUF3387 domain-containing protein [Actinomycetota bacterium]
TYEILSPDPFLRPYIEDFSRIAGVYRLLRSSFEQVEVDRSFYRKTALLVQEQTRSGVIRPPDEVYELGEDALAKIEKLKKPDVVKVFNLLKLIDKEVKEKGRDAPYLIPIGDRAEAVITAYQERQLSTQQALEQLRLALDEIEEAERKQEETGLSTEGLTGLLILEEDGVDKTLEVATEMAGAFAAWPHWRRSEEHERELRRALYKAVLKSGSDHTGVVDRLLDVLKKGSA